MVGADRGGDSAVGRAHPPKLPASPQESPLRALGVYPSMSSPHPESGSWVVVQGSPWGWGRSRDHARSRVLRARIAFQTHAWRRLTYL